MIGFGEYRYGFPSTNSSSSTVSKRRSSHDDALALKVYPIYRVGSVPRIDSIVCARAFFHSQLALYFIDLKCVSGSIKAVPKTTRKRHAFLYHKSAHQWAKYSMYCGILRDQTHRQSSFNKNRIHKFLFYCYKTPHCKHSFVLNDLIYSVFAYFFFETFNVHQASFFLFPKIIMIYNWIPIPMSIA